MAVIARMRCHAIKAHGDYGKTVYLSPVYSPDPSDPNYSYSQATPSGEVYLQITNPGAYEQFEENKVYDMTIVELGTPVG